MTMKPPPNRDDSILPPGDRSKTQTVTLKPEHASPDQAASPVPVPKPRQVIGLKRSTPGEAQSPTTAFDYEEDAEASPPPDSAEVPPAPLSPSATAIVDLRGQAVKQTELLLQAARRQAEREAEEIMVRARREAEKLLNDARDAGEEQSRLPLAPIWRIAFALAAGVYLVYVLTRSEGDGLLLLGTAAGLGIDVFFLVRAYSALRASKRDRKPKKQP